MEFEIAVVKLLLSSRERKALFRPIQWVHYSDDSRNSERLSTLLTDLDDGGIWNPCFLKIPDDFEEKILIVYCIKRVKDKTAYSHDLQTTEERFQYIDSLRDEPKSGDRRRWPFLTSGDYYGPNWDRRRSEILARDSYECVECGITRDSHKELYDHDLHVHHIKPKSACDSFEETNDPENLITLCRECHAEKEKVDWL
jgi:hypothetical protein